jgi:hypothetical protein
MEDKELARPEDYFPYIGHDLDHQKIRRSPHYRYIIGGLFTPQNIEDRGDTIRVRLGSRPGLFTRGALFRDIEIRGVAAHRRLAGDPHAVVALVPRHRTLYDYLLHMPAHHWFVNPEVMILAGNNLFVSKYDRELRYFGGFMFLREDAVLDRDGLPPARLSIKRYLDDVFPAYLRQQMFEGVGKGRVKRDLILYAGQEKNPETGKRSGGRTKTGRIRALSPIFFDKFKALVRANETALYIAPVNISFSKYPDAPFVAHPVEHQGLVKQMRYVGEQHFVMRAYPWFAQTHYDAELEAVVRYGEPVRFTGEGINGVRDTIRYAHEVQEKIGLMETLFPTVFVYRALDQEHSLSLDDLGERARRLYDGYAERGVDVSRLSVRQGEMLPIADLVDAAIRTLNCNPSMYIWGVRHDRFLSLRGERVVSHDLKLQAWYANNIRHLDV